MCAGSPYFAYTEALAAREDMEEFVPENKPETAVPDVKTQAETNAMTGPGPDAADTPATDDVDANKEQLIIGAISMLNIDTDFTNAQPGRPPKPRTDALSEKLQFEVSAAERDAAWFTYQQVYGGKEE